MVGAIVYKPIIVTLLAFAVAITWLYTVSAQTSIITPIPLYFNDEMSPDKVGQFNTRVPQRRFGTVSKRVEIEERHA